MQHIPILKIILKWKKVRFMERFKEDITEIVMIFVECDCANFL